MMHSTTCAISLNMSRSRYTGKERDSESGNDYFGARYYASSMGRWMSPDPGWFFAADPSNPQSWNMYSYALDNPLTNIDPNGYDCVYLNAEGNGIDKNGVDTNSNSGECNDHGGYWVDGTVKHVQLYSNNDDVGLTGSMKDTNGNTISTDAFYTSATGHLGWIAQQVSPGITGTIDLSKLVKNRITTTIGARDPVDLGIDCAANGIPKLALDLSPIGIVPDAIDAMQQASLNPLFNSGNKLNDAGNAVDVAGKASDAMKRALPFLGPVAKKLGPVGMTISVVKAGRDYYDCNTLKRNKSIRLVFGSRSSRFR